MEELVVNLHIHSNYSDGSWNHKRIAEAAMHANLDAIIITDHNLMIKGIEGYFKNKEKSILVIVGEEIHDKSLDELKNHLLTFGQMTELCIYADEPQNLINMVKKSGGLSFLAHPYENSLPQVNEQAITWENWDVVGFNGIEIWNHLSELKNESRNWFELLVNIFFPKLYARGPHPLAIKKWDELLRSGHRLVAIGGSDAHALEMKKGFIKRIIFPYLFHFKSINNHILIPEKLSGNYLLDRKNIIEAFRRGNSFIGYDMPASTKGFRFYAQGKNGTAIPGDEIELESSITFQIKIPEPVECRLIHNGEIIQTWHDQDICAYTTKSPGYYRVECYVFYYGKKRTWIVSNPIHVITPKKLASNY